MKLNFKKDQKQAVGFLVLAVLGLAILSGEGCDNKVPPANSFSVSGTPTPGAYGAPANQFNYTLVSNFEGNLNPTPEPTNSVNSHLFETGVPGNIVQEPGLWMAVTNFANQAATMTFMGPGANGTAVACNYTGFINDPGDGTYPSLSLVCYLDLSQPAPYKAYHAGFFTGVQFYFNIMPDDTTTDRHFYIQTTQEQPPSNGGTCTAGNKCYNFFGTPTGWLPKGTNGWQKFTFNFTDLTPTPYGWQPTPPTLTGVNLDQVICLDFSEGRANTYGFSNVDFWVDEVSFF